MTPVGAGCEQQQTTAAATSGVGTFSSGAGCMLGTDMMTGAAGDSPGMVYGSTSLPGASW